ncbi:uncharacterized protein LOC108097908 [Drosophila ficusphila]|uniref:uncharacterized protein LOC108097908 n=1 Tax=Drosophila ficusphila TaxID=30025 RepID=UPI0007E833CC|nr:uncharacterized protein LOC108097908 [Drosophila ficusphila]
MCMPYLSKLFGGGNRRERRTRNGGITPLPSLANMPNVNQISMDTMRTAKSTKSAKSVKSVKSGKSGKSASRRNSVDDGVGNMESPAEQPMAAASRVANAASMAPSGTPATPAEGADTRKSWWRYLTMNRNKKSSVASL